MHRQALVAAALGPIVAAALVFPARAQLQDTAVGAWTVGGYTRDGAFTHCAMSTRTAHASRTVLFYVGRRIFQLAMSDRQWSLAQGTRFQGFYQIDGGPQVPVQATAVRPTILNFTIVAENVVFAQFRTASTLRLGIANSPEFDAVFTIANSSPAFDRLYSCAQAGMAMPRDRPPGGSEEQVGAPPGQTRPIARPPASPPQQPATPPATRPASPGRPSDPTENAIGTGFYVSAAGHIVTAEHVVRGCKVLRAQSIGDVPLNVALVAKSESDDLALLKGDAKRTVIAPFRSGPLRLGEQIVLFGFPLPGALASSGNLTTGNIAALAGLKDDHRMMQISAPAQPGNSGGPIIDLRGRIVGVLVHSISAARFARATGTLPQNLNFGVKASVVLSFLEAHGVAVQQGGAEADLAVADVAERARAFTVRIECLN